MSTPDDGALPPMKPSALPEMDALTTTELANALDNCPTHELSMYLAIAIDRLRALAAATEEKDKPRWHPMGISGHDGEWFLETKGYMAGILFLNSDFTLAEARDFLARANRSEQSAESKLTELERELAKMKEDDERTAEQLTEHAEAAGVSPDHIDYIDETTRAIIRQYARATELERENRELRERSNVVWADGLCPKCSEYMRPTKAALERAGVPTGEQNWPEWYGVEIITRLSRQRDDLYKLLRAIEDGKVSDIVRAKEDAEHTIKLFAKRWTERNERHRAEQQQKEALDAARNGGAT